MTGLEAENCSRREVLVKKEGFGAQVVDWLLIGAELALTRVNAEKKQVGLWIQSQKGKKFPM